MMGEAQGGKRVFLRSTAGFALLVLSCPIVASAHPQPKRVVSSTPANGVHTVKGGETLSAIAKQHRVRLVDLAKVNRLVSPYRLRIGQRLLLPLPGDGRAGGANSGLKPPPTLMTFVPPELNSVTHSWVWPVIGPLSSLYGLRQRGWHGGIDIKADAATPVKAVADGTVTASEWAKGYGRFIKVEHGDGLTTVYAHNLQNFVEAGHVVTAGQVIGSVGRSGRATSHHLHFEVWLNGKLVNPLFVLPPNGSQEIMTPEVDEEDEEE